MNCSCSQFLEARTSCIPRSSLAYFSTLTMKECCKTYYFCSLVLFLLLLWLHHWKAKWYWINESEINSNWQNSLANFKKLYFMLYKLTYMIQKILATGLLDFCRSIVYIIHLCSSLLFSSSLHRLGIIWADEVSTTFPPPSHTAPDDECSKQDPTNTRYQKDGDGGAQNNTSTQRLF